jgi:hypothetical protein
VITLARRYLDGVAGSIVTRFDLFQDGIGGNAAGIGIAAVGQVIALSFTPFWP